MKRSKKTKKSNTWRIKQHRDQFFKKSKTLGYRSRAAFKLIELSSRKVVFVGSARSVISYNILDADFATMSVMTDAKKRAAKDLATEIRSRLSVIGS